MTFDKDHSVEADELELEQVLRNFRHSVHAWSDAEYSRPRMATAARHTWRMAVAWALGCVLAVGGLGAGLYQHHQNQLAGNARIKGDRIHQGQQTQTPDTAAMEKASVAVTPAEQVAQADSGNPDAGFLTEVDSDVSKQVPNAMEPLAQLMDGSSGR